MRNNYWYYLKNILNNPVKSAKTILHGRKLKKINVSSVLIAGLLCITYMMLKWQTLDRCSGQQAVLYTGSISERQHLRSFVLVGDTQRTSFWEFWREQNDSARIAVLQKIASENPAFVIILGDLVSQGSNPIHWQQFDEYTADIRNSGIPIFPVLGNHDYFGNKERALGHYFSRFPHLEKSKWIAFRFLSVGIILLNSNFNELKDNERRQQHSWFIKKISEFQNDLALTTILVACHHPPYTNSKVVSDDKDVQRTFVEPFIATPKAKLFFSGHCHSYEHFVKNDKHFIVSGGGGGPRQLLEIDAEKQRHSDTYKGGPLRDFHFCRFSILTEGVQVQMVRLNKGLREWSIGEEFVVR